MVDSGQVVTPGAAAPRARLASLFASFVRVGGGMFGGGYAMLPLLEREVVERRRWATHEAMADLFALAQAIPGVIAVNTAMLIGQRLRGWRGAVAAALGMVTPSLIIIMLIAAFLRNFENNPIVRHAFTAISITVCALIIDAVIGLWKKGVKDVLGIFISMAAFALAAFSPLSPVILVVAAAFLGIFVKKAKEGKG